MNAINLANLISENQLKSKYEEIVSKKHDGFCLVTISLKRFSKYLHIIGQDKHNEVLDELKNIFCSLLEKDEFVSHIHYNYFTAILKCNYTLDSLHDKVAKYHYAIRDKMDLAFGRKMFTALGFYPIQAPYTNYLDAVYFAHLSRKGQEYYYKETNYDMYGLSYIDSHEEFRQLETYVQSAMENGHFKLYLQPKVNLKTGKVTSAEALVRWHDPQRGFIPLNDFLPHMEENGYIRDLDCYLFNIACKYMDKWFNKFNKKINISFNLNKAYFSGSFFMPEYTEVFNKYSFPPECVCIELLESIVLDDVEHLQPLVKEIYDFGFSCALDDFGSGFSAFSVLTSVPLSELKIDRSLFRNIDNPKEQLLIKHIVEIGHDMGMKCVAEGVETKEYADYLKNIGCDYIQGYYYYKPMPIEEFEAQFVTNN